MKLRFRFRDYCCAALLAVLAFFLTLSCLNGLLALQSSAYAEDESEYGRAQADDSEYFVTIYDQGSVLTVKTARATVAEVLERSAIILAETDLVDPGLDTEITSDYNINIYRARPAIVIDGAVRRYVMTASFDPKQIAIEAGLTVYDGDEVKPEVNHNFLETGAASTYRIQRNGGRQLTIEETLPYPTETRYDYTLAKGETILEQAGEDGRRVSVYQIEFVDNTEVSRELISETIVVEPVPEIITIGAKVSIPPEREECAGWAREAGVSEADLEAALDLIYHESGCRVDATNPSSGAYGIPQSLPGYKMASMGDDWQTNPVTQIRWMADYVATRYGGWHEAQAFWWCTGICTNRNGSVTKRGYWY